MNNCKKFVKAKPGSNCIELAFGNNLSLEEFATWNKGVGGTTCSSLWANTYQVSSVDILTSLGLVVNTVSVSGCYRCLYDVPLSVVNIMSNETQSLSIFSQRGRNIR